MSEQEPLWTTKEVAQYLAVSQSWVEHAAPRGLIPSLRIGRLRRFVPAEIRAYALRQRVDRRKKKES